MGTSASPTKAWARLLGTSWHDFATALTTGTDGAIYMAGATSGSLDGQTNSHYYDAFLTRYNPDGTKAWTRLLGSSVVDQATALTTGVDGAVYMAGFTNGSLDGQTNSGDADAFLTRYNPDGTKVWTRLLGTSSLDQAYAITTGADGAIYVAGITNGSLEGQTNKGSYDAFLTKYDANGNKAWTRLLGANEWDQATALTTGADGAIYVTGYTNSSLDGIPFNGNADVFLAKYDANGNKAWTRTLGTVSNESAKTLTIGTDGAIYIAGSTESSLDGQTHSGRGDAFLAKYDANGNKAWTRLLGTSSWDYAAALTAGTDGGIYMAGRTEGSLDGQTHSGGWDAFLTKYDSNGNKAWTKLLGTSGYNYATALTTGTDGAIYMAGDTENSLDEQTYSGAGDAFLTKWVVATDSISPTVVVTSSKSSMKSGETATISFTLSEVSTDFTASDVAVSGGTLSNFEGSGANYTATFTPTVDSIVNAVISVASDKFSDAAGNFNKDGSDADNTVSMAVDTRSASYTPGQSVIDLGSYGKLIHPVQVDGGRWYYYWDRSGDGTSADAGFLNGGADIASQSAAWELPLGYIFYKNINLEPNPHGLNVDSTYRYAELNGVKLALPTFGDPGLTEKAGVIGNYVDWSSVKAKSTTAVGNSTPINGSNQVNAAYDDLLAIWDAYNGTAVGNGIGVAGTPPGWRAGLYISATRISDGHIAFPLASGGGVQAGSPWAQFWTGYSSVALEVLPGSLPAEPHLIEGTAGDDSLNAGSLTGHYVLRGLAGNDRINAAGKTLNLEGGDGNDSLTVDGVFGGFWIEGGIASVSGQNGNDELFVLNFSQAKIYGGEGNDRLLADQVRNVSAEGGDGEDTIYLGYIYYRSGNSDGSNYKPKVHVLDGGADNDVLTAQGFSYSGHGQGFITMRGGEGDDILTLTDQAAGKQKWESSLRPYTSNNQYGVSAAVFEGGDGNDYLSPSGVLQVTLSGGSGTDRFVLTAQQWYTFSAGDINVKTEAGLVLVQAKPVEITDFSPGASGDILELSDLLTKGTNLYNGENPFSSGHLKLTQQGPDTLLQFDEDGLTSGDFVLQTFAVLRNVSAADLTAANFTPNFDFSEYPTVQFATSSGSSNEGNTGSTTITVQATLSAASAQVVTVPITYSGTATQGTDYTNATKSITIAAGQTTGTASFSVIGDSTVEPDETVILTIGTPSNAVLGTNTNYTHTLTNDDFGALSGNESFGAVQLIRTSAGASEVVDTNGQRFTVKDVSGLLWTNQVGNEIVAADYYQGYRVVVFDWGHAWYVDSSWTKAPVGPGNASTLEFSQDQMRQFFFAGTSDGTSRNIEKNPESDHYYEFIETRDGIRWTDALEAAAKQNYRGLQGYLVTLTSAQEDSFVYSQFSNFASNVDAILLGATDQETEGVWKWADGPEKGQEFWLGKGSDAGGQPLSNMYSNWGGGVEPNDSGAYHTRVPGVYDPQDWLIYLPARFNALGTWADNWINAYGELSNTPDGGRYAGYIVEFGGLPATYTITPSSTSVNEGSSVTFTIDTKNVEWGTEIAYTLNGITQADLASGFLTGTAIVNQQGADGRATVTVNLASDQITEGAESLRLTVESTTSSAVTVNDTSVSADRTGRTKYFVTQNVGGNFTDFDLDHPGVTLQNELIEFIGSTGVDTVFVRPGVVLDFTFSGAGSDKVYLPGAFADYSTSLAGNTMTLQRGSGSTLEKVSVVAATSAEASDQLVFSDGVVNSHALYGHMLGQQAAPVPNSSETSNAPLPPAQPGSPLDATIKAFGLNPDGDTFAMMKPGVALMAHGGIGVDKVYVADASVVDATLLGASADQIYLRGFWSEYTKTVAGTTIVLTRALDTITEGVTVAAGEFALNDTLIFADGAVSSLAARAALGTNLAVALQAIAGFDANLKTPGVGPSLVQSALDDVSNLDPTSNIVLNFTMPVTAGANKFIRIVNDAASATAATGFRGESANNTLVIAANDASQVSISGSRVTINPTADLDLANRYHIEIDEGAFIAPNAVGSRAVNAASGLNFATVTPGSYDLSVAAASQTMTQDGVLAPSAKWLDIEGIGSQPSNRVMMDLGAASYVLVFKDYASKPAVPADGYSGVDAPTFFIAANNFGADDRIYIDNQSSVANDLSVERFLSTGAAPTRIQFAPSTTPASLGGYLDVTLVGSTQPFTSINDWMAMLPSTVPPMISG